MTGIIHLMLAKKNLKVMGASTLALGGLLLSSGVVAPSAEALFGTEAFATTPATAEAPAGSLGLEAWATQTSKNQELKEAAIKSLADARRVVAALEEEHQASLDASTAAINERDAGIKSLEEQRAKLAAEKVALAEARAVKEEALVKTEETLEAAEVKAAAEAKAATREVDAAWLQAARENAAAKEAQAEVVALKLQLAQKDLELLEAQALAAAALPVEEVAIEEGAPSENKSLARSMMKDRGYAAKQISCVNRIWDQESAFKTTAENKTSGAYGIPQALPARKMASAGSDWKTNPATQIKWGLDYIEERYGDACTAAAFKFEEGNGWY